MTAPHPAKWSQAVLDAIGDVVYELLPDGGRVLDPFAGVGIERLAKAVGDDSLVVGVELEQEWLPEGGDMVQANSVQLPFRAASFDALATSPAYGNRMADNHEAKDACKTCRGSGCTAEGCLGAHPDDGQQHRVCRGCGGSGLSKRNTYAHTLGRKPSEGATTVLQWGEKYRALHEAVWAECRRVLKPGALVLVNVSNHIRDGREKHVAEWHLNAWMLLGARVHHVERIPTPRLGFGANGQTRVDGELLLVLQLPPV